MKEQDVQTQCQDEYNKKETKLMHGRHLHRCSPEDQTHLTKKMHASLNYMHYNLFTVEIHIGYYYCAQNQKNGLKSLEFVCIFAFIIYQLQTSSMEFP